jgi:hypothetical protein
MIIMIIYKSLKWVFLDTNSTGGPERVRALATMGKLTRFFNVFQLNLILHRHLQQNMFRMI